MFVGIAYAADSSTVQIDPTLYNAMVWIIVAFGSALLALGVRYVWYLIQSKDDATNPKHIYEVHRRITRMEKSFLKEIGKVNVAIAELYPSKWNGQDRRQ